jgi:hypothetical protein
MRQSVVLCVCALLVLTLLSEVPEQGEPEQNKARINNVESIFISLRSAQDFRIFTCRLSSGPRKWVVLLAVTQAAAL